MLPSSSSAGLRGQILRAFKTAALVTASLCVMGSARATSIYDQTVEAQSGLLGYYTFTQASQANSVVNGYTGTLENGAAIGAAGSGPAIASDPNSSSLVLANGSSGTAYAIAGGANPLQGQINQSGTILAWINLASLPNGSRIYSVAGESAGGDDLDLQINGDNSLYFYTDGGSSVSVPLSVADLNTWVFVAATFTAGSDRNIYIDGTLAASNTPGGHSLNNADFYIGNSAAFGNRYFDGAIADVALYNTELTADQISAIYASANSTQTTPPPTGAPEPLTLSLFGAGLAGLGATRRKLNRKV